MISTRLENQKKITQLNLDIERMISEGYILYKEKYLISKLNDVPYRLIKDGCKYYTKMVPIAINLTGSVVKGVPYLYKSIGFNGTSRYYLHRLVWEAHKGAIPKGMTIDHIDNNNKNNNLSNLQLLTQGANSKKGMLRTWETGRLTGDMLGHGKEVICNETEAPFKTILEAGMWLIKHTHINSIESVKVSLSRHLNKSIKSPTKTVGGYTFRFKEV